MFNDIVNNGLQQAIPAAKAAPAAKASTSATESTQQAKPEANAKVEPRDLQSAVSKLNDYVQNVQRTLSFSVEEATGVTVVRVYDSETEELIRQIPAEETIKLAASLEAQTQSLLFKEQA